MSLSLPRKDLSNKDFEHLSRLSVGELYSQIGWGVSVKLNVEPIDRHAAFQPFRPSRARRFRVAAQRSDFLFKGAPSLPLPKKPASISRGKRFVSKYKRAVR